MSARRPRVLLVGAYERDNFGDLLFLLQTEQYLRHADVTEAAPFPGDMRHLLDRHIPAYGPLLENEQFDHVWTVGGEVGATTFLGAFQMAAPDALYRSFRDGTADTRRDLLRSLTGSVPIESPYMPRLSAYPRNESASAVLHSVGLAAIRREPAERREALVRILREAGAITVRDHASSDLLRREGIAHELSPDVVHTISLTRPRSRPPEPRDVVIQVSAAHLRNHGVEAHAEAIAAGPHLRRERLRFLLAGTARGHDSVEAYRALIQAIHHIDPVVDASILDARRPYALVDAIQGAKLWVGLSLHGRIVAAAYDVPRISLVKAKLDAYARTWDPGMPFGVTADTLDAAVAEALSPAVQAGSASLGPDLARQSDARVRQVVADAIGAPVEDRLSARLRGVDAHRGAQVAQRDERLRRLELENRRLRDLVDRDDVDQILRSRPYRMARTVARTARTARRRSGR